MLLEQNSEFQGLHLTGSIDLVVDIAIIIGRNGAGKSRLLQAISEGKITVTYDGAPVPLDRIKINQLQPNLVFGFDPVLHRDAEAQAKITYRNLSAKFRENPEDTISAIGQNGAPMARRGINISALAYAANRASEVTGKRVDELSEQDIADFYSGANVAQLGALNVTATMREYLLRRRNNDFNSFLNERDGTSFPYYPPGEFIQRFGPAPWEVFNDLLTLVLDGKYHILRPLDSEHDTYEAELYRSDGKTINPGLLSAGEKTLLWLCLSMYNVRANILDIKPLLLLFDEPDSTLHPKMIQKLHLAINMLGKKFQCAIIFTSHSPTTVALSDLENIFRIDEGSLIPIEKDAAIAELLVGVDQISVQYKNNRQIYVESHNDARIYAKIFSMLRLWGKVAVPHVSLSFIPAAPKLSVELVRQLHVSIFGKPEGTKLDEFIVAINGQGNCEQVVGAVESLASKGNSTVGGIIDWDSNNKKREKIHVLGENIFYSIENAVLNPLTLGIYLLNFFPGEIKFEDYGVPNDIDLIILYDTTDKWQHLSDAVTRRVLGRDVVNHDVEVEFLNGAKIYFDREYVHMNGHSLEALVRRSHIFLNRFQSQNPLILDVVTRGMQTSRGRTMPAAFEVLLGNVLEH